MTSLKLLLRFLTVGGLVLLLLIPLSMIRGLVHDRENYRQQAVERVSQSMAGPQQLVGPLRVVPWKGTRRVNGAGPDGRIEVREETVEGFLLQAPATFQASGPVEPGVRRIGLHAVRVFQWKARVAADFARALESLADHPLVGDVRHRGLLGAIELVSDKATKRGFDAAPGLADAIAAIAYRNQLVFRSFADQILGFAPALCITPQECELLGTRLRRTLDEVLALPQVRAALA